MQSFSTHELTVCSPFFIKYGVTVTIEGTAEVNLRYRLNFLHFTKVGCTGLCYSALYCVPVIAFSPSVRK